MRRKASIPAVRASALPVKAEALPIASVEFPLQGSLIGRSSTVGTINGTFTRATTATLNHNGTIYSVASGDPRFQSTNVPLGILIEGARTNSFLNSDTPATHTSPSLGIATYTLWIPDGTSVAVAANTAVGTGFGTATPGSPVTFSITTAGTVDFTVTGTPTYAQCENGAFPSSYIPTAGAAVTRNTDQLSYTLGSWFNSTEGTIVVETQTPYLFSSAQIFEFSDNTLNNRIFLQITATNVSGVVVDTGVTQASISGIHGLSDGDTYKIAFCWKLNDFAVYLNGNAVGTDNAGTIPTGLTDLDVGQNSISVGQAFSNIKNIYYTALRLPNADLSRLST